MPVRGVIFDYGGVLCHHPTSAQIADAAELCGVSSEEFVRALWRHRLQYDAGQDPHEYWRTCASLMGREFSEAHIATMIEHEIGFWSTLDDRVVAWVDQLRAAGYRTGILSNLPIPLGTRLRQRDGFLDHFDHVTFSFELGCVKPQREIYDHALRGIGVPPDEVLFIDDRPENIKGAREAGLLAELYSTWEDFPQIAARYNLPAARR
jgi:putative hydrolase of the HAD superfamily